MAGYPSFRFKPNDIYTDILDGDISAGTDPINTTDNTNAESGPCLIKIDNEIIKCTTKGANNFSTLERGYNGTTAASHSSGAVITHPISADIFVKMWEAIEAIYGGALDIVTAKGDILVASAADTLAKLAIGTDNQVLVVETDTPGWADWLIDEDNMASDLDTVAPTQQSVKAYVTSSATPADGWTAAGTFTYASATTITVAAGAAAIYQVGDKIKLTQTTPKYFYITAVADTQLTVNGGGIYTVADAAITSPYYSHQHTPLLFPIKMIPGYVKARAYLSADQDQLTNATWTKVELDTESYDTGGDFAVGTYDFIVPVTGYYPTTVKAVLHDLVADGGYGYVDIAIYVDPLGVGAPAVASTQENWCVAAEDRHTLILTDRLFLNKTDKVYMYVRSSVGVSKTDVTSGATNTSMEIELGSVI